ncbi:MULTISPECIES: hypothetical protein [Pseudomonas]|uniref:hypothetical protein n=1 Tax=Pseudomonas TaxID=286 RepID=UPI0011D2B645|nr:MULTISPECIES: hypothetical protein [Pseudomonas]MBZ6462090.1 hypothetical protein [Pseudomonas fluorescens group sp.]MBZ6467382.1 hypothetical protein [Pseudomonas fluorescens group sp.]QUE92627.1 hypothetical protein KBP52_09540 [Pseudomonas sp. SCA2728.1_7]
MSIGLNSAIFQCPALYTHLRWLDLISNHLFSELSWLAVVVILMKNPMYNDLRKFVYGLLLVTNLLCFGARADCTYSASYYGIVLMQGHDGLFARRLPIAFTCFTHLDIKGFADAGSTGLPLLELLRNRGVWGFSRMNGSGRCPIQLVISAVVQHRPSHACSFVGQWLSPML